MPRVKKRIRLIKKPRITPQQYEVKRWYDPRRRASKYESLLEGEGGERGRKSKREKGGFFFSGHLFLLP